MSELRNGQDSFLERACDHRILTRSEEIALAKRIEQGDQSARHTLVEHNIRLGVQMARRYQNSGVPFEDLCQEAFIGLNRAAEKFDYRKGFKFSTYATWWIRHMLQRAIHRDRSTIRVPGHIIERQRKINKYLLEVNPNASDEELSERLEIKLHHVEDARQPVRVVASMDAPLSNETNEDGGNWHAVVQDEDAIDPAELINEASSPLAVALDKLDPLEAEVLRLRFGFDGPSFGRDDIADRLGVKPHVVQRAQRSGLAKLRRDKTLKSVASTLDEN